jgi:hypothetical protein
MNKGQSAGVISNLMAESRMTAINEKDPLVKGSRGGFGWMQWTGQRRLDFEAYCKKNGLDPKSDEANYGFLLHDLHSIKGLLPGLKSTQSAKASADLFYTQAESGGAAYLEKNRAGHVANAERIASLGPVPTQSNRYSSTSAPAAVTHTNTNTVTIGDVHMQTAATDGAAAARDFQKTISDRSTLASGFNSSVAQ